MSEDVNRMKLRSPFQVRLLATLAIGIALSNSASGAEWDSTSGHRSKYRRFADAEVTAPCRTGWWQTLRYGHVRPHWGTLCYR
jgi:hypothetical protein